MIAQLAEMPALSLAVDKPPATGRTSSNGRDNRALRDESHRDDAGEGENQAGRRMPYRFRRHVISCGPVLLFSTRESQEARPVSGVNASVAAELSRRDGRWIRA